MDAELFDEDPSSVLLNRVVVIELPMSPSDESFIGKAALGYRQYGEQLWEICRAAILYWTPSRLETEALRRASDGVESSVARMTAVLVEKYLQWLPGQNLLEANWLDPGGPRLLGSGRQVLAGSFVRERLQESVEMLERRAASVEARALDLRLRFDHQKLVAELFGKQLQSTLTDAIQLALSQAPKDVEIERLARRIDQLSVIAPTMEIVQKEVEFIADQSMAVFAERKMQPAALAALRKLGGIVTSTVGKFGLSYLLKRLTDGA